MINGPGWAFISGFEMRRDGRRAYQALRDHYEGDAAQGWTKGAAYHAIQTCSYAGEKTRFGYEDYVQIHARAHGVIQENREPIPEQKKVTDFL